MTQKSALGRGLGSLIPHKQTITEQVIPSAHTEVLDISVDEIAENPHQPRQYFSPAELEDLIASIKEFGIIQPLVVTRNNGEYELIAGERRLRASRTLGLSTVPVIVRDVNEQEKLELALIENIQRQDLNAIEEALAYRALIDEFNLKQEEVASRVGKSRSNVANTLRLLDLDPEVLEALKVGKLSKTHARTLLAEPDLQKRHQLFLQILDGGVSVREVEARASNTGSRKKHGQDRKDPNILAHEKRLREILGTKVDIQEAAGKGKIMISFYSREELMDLLDQLID
jgi:ParB family transcriptional regulator, chromosome partitioning protein